MTYARIGEAVGILAALGLPRAQVNDRSALTLLALADLGPDVPWSRATAPLRGITPIMDWARDRYGVAYAPNSRETFRRFTMHQFLEAGLVLYNPDRPTRPVNSPAAVYQLSPATLALLRTYDSPAWEEALATYLAEVGSLAARYARDRDMTRVPVRIGEGQMLHLSPGEHSDLIRAIVEQFAPRFARDSVLIYAGDTGEKMGHFDRDRLADLGVTVDSHGKMPDVVLYYGDRDWLLLVEAVTSHGPVDAKRHAELTALFAGSRPGLVYVTAFPSRAVMARYLGQIAWETEVWVADNPSHLIHFNGVRFLGPYPVGD